MTAAVRCPGCGPGSQGLEWGLRLAWLVQAQGWGELVGGQKAREGAGCQVGEPRGQLARAWVADSVPWSGDGTASGPKWGTWMLTPGSAAQDTEALRGACRAPRG